MKKKHAILILIVGLLVIALCILCLEKKPSISITTEEGVEIDIYSRDITEVNHEDVDLFIKLCNLDNISYVNFDTQIEVSHKEKGLDSIELYEYILKENGERKYRKFKYEPIKIKELKDKIVFSIEPNFMALLSSNSEDYMPGRTYKGYRLVFIDGDKKKEHCFVLRTDAM